MPQITANSPKLMSGARAKVGVLDRNTGKVKTIGIFSNVSYGVVYDTQAAYILGSYIAQEVDYTAVELVQITASGWRVRKHGVHTEGLLPRVQQLLFHEYLEFIVTDRQAEEGGEEPRVARLRYVRPTSGGGGFTNRQLAEVTLSYVGILVDDEDGTNDETSSAAQLIQPV